MKEYTKEQLEIADKMCQLFYGSRLPNAMQTAFKLGETREEVEELIDTLIEAVPLAKTIEKKLGSKNED